MNMTKKKVKWKPKLSIIYENKIIDESIKSINKNYKKKIIKNKKNEINDLVIECFEF